MIPVSLQTLAFMKKQEADKLKAYKDFGGVWTIGEGMTEIYGRPVREGDVLTQSEDDRLNGDTIRRFQNHVLGVVKVQITQNQLTALTSFTYNEGTAALDRSILLKKLNAKDYKGAADGFLQWERVKNDSHALKNRREAERALFLS